LEQQIEILQRKLSRERRALQRLEELKIKNENIYLTSLNELKSAHDELHVKNTELKNAQILLIESEGLAKSASHAKSVFLTKMSHELRTPLTAIIGYTELVLEQELADPVQSLKDINLILRSGKHLLSLVNDILDVSKIEAGQTRVHLEKFEMYDLLFELSEECSLLISKNNNKLKFKIDRPLEILSDKKCIRQCVYNLLSNAAKFTESGNIELSCFKEADRLKIVVSDTGIGMSEDHIKNIFDEFFQVNTDMGSKYGGTGLGLSIIKGMLKLIGGKVQVKSALGKGSTFIITLPINGINS